MPNEQIIQDDFKNAVKDTFAREFREPVILEVYTRSGYNDQFNEATIALINTLAELTDKLKVYFYEIGSKQAQKRNVKRSPTVLISPDKYNIRYTGAPVGEESRSFLTALIMASTGGTILSASAADKIKNSLKEKRDIRIFVSPTCPYCPRQVLTAFSAAFLKPDLVSAEAVEIYENQDLAKSLGSLAVPQTFINDIFTGAGLQPEPWFVESLLSVKEPETASTKVSGEPVEKDVVVIGGGPAGLTAAIYAERAGLNTIVIEKKNLGGQLAITPVVENYPGFMQIGGKSLVDLIAQQAAQYSQIHIGEFVTEISKERKDGKISLKTNHAIYITRALIIATGVDNRTLEASGSRKYFGKGISYCATCDGYFFKDGKKVIVVGGGNTALTDALYLKNLGADVMLVHRSENLRAEKKLQESFRLSGIPAQWNSVIREIRGNKVVKSVVIEDKKTGNNRTMPVEGIFVAIGYVPSNDIARQLGLEMDDDGYIKTDLMTMRTSVPGVYAAGDITGAPKQIVVAVSHGSVAAMTAFEDLAGNILK